MVFNEASGTANWAVPAGRVGSRPGCAAIPLALGNEGPALSFGCAGMRTFTEIPDDRMLGVVPGAQLSEFVTALTGIAEANARMQSFYDGRKAAV